VEYQIESLEYPTKIDERMGVQRDGSIVIVHPKNKNKMYLHRGRNIRILTRI